VGGLGLTTENVGLIYGTLGLIALHWWNFRWNCYFKKKVELLHTSYDFNNALTYHWFILLAHYQPTTLFNLYLDLNLLLSIGPLIHISTAVVIEQLGYGMGLAFMMYLIYVAE
jgi:PAT family beta-lactamase induction signal transducer AmpG